MAQRGRPKKTKAEETEQVAAVAPDTEAQESEPVMGSTIAPFRCCAYHEEFEPRIFNKGDVIPDGWTREKGSLKAVWLQDFDGKWYKG